MSTYHYKARDQFSKSLEGIMAAESENAVALKLKQMGYIPISINQSKGKQKFTSIFEGLRGIKSSELNMFSRQLYALQKAGLPLLGSLMALRDQAANRTFKNVLGQIIRDIEGGVNLSLALESHPRIFDNIYVNMIRSGEVSGRLSEILERLTSLGERDEKIRLRIKTALRYPMIVVLAIIIAFMILIIVVLPKFAQLYSQFKTQLPLPTRILIGLNFFLTHYWWLIIILLILGSIAFIALIRTKKGKYYWDKLKLRLPIFGPLLLKLALSRFGRINGTLMKSGVPLLQILDLVAEGEGNVIISKTYTQVKKSVNEGKGMLEPMKTSGLFPPVVTQMVAVGEETGKLDELLLHVSDYYDVEIDYTINNLVTLIEPILTFFLAIVVLFVALGVFMPMWNMIHLYKR